jgi:hypothetical protein
MGRNRPLARYPPPHTIEYPKLTSASWTLGSSPTPTPNTVEGSWNWLLINMLSARTMDGTILANDVKNVTGETSDSPPWSPNYTPFGQKLTPVSMTQSFYLPYMWGIRYKWDITSYGSTETWLGPFTAVRTFAIVLNTPNMDNQFYSGGGGSD